MHSLTTSIQGGDQHSAFRSADGKLNASSRVTHHRKPNARPSSFSPKRRRTTRPVRDKGNVERSSGHNLQSTTIHTHVAHSEDSD